jgi:hypothetical protein
MLEIVFIALTFLFGFFALYLKNETLKTFFFLLTLLMVVVDVALPKILSETRTCLQFNASGVCQQWEIKDNLIANDAFMYGFGILLVLFFFITLIQLFVKAAKAWFG